MSYVPGGPDDPLVRAFLEFQARSSAEMLAAHLRNLRFAAITCTCKGSGTPTCTVHGQFMMADLETVERARRINGGW
jgi:hypothetical protein